MDYKFLSLKDFEYVGYKYEDPGLLTKTSIQGRGKKFRVYYYLPNGMQCDHYKTPIFKSQKERSAYIAEFNHALASGYLPPKGAEKLKKSSYNPKEGNFHIFLGKYFGEYAVGKRFKEAGSSSTQRSMLTRIIQYFEGLDLSSICEITDAHLKEWDQSLQFTPTLRKKGFLAPPSRNNWRKALRAFLNTAKEQEYQLRCHPELMNIYEYGKGGEIDHNINARLIIYPKTLIDAVQICSYRVDINIMPDIRKIIRLWREIGLRPMEMYTLSESNIDLKNGYPYQLTIKAHESCPNGSKYGFKPKNKKSYRSVPLSDWASEYLFDLLRRLRGIKRYGKYKGQLKEYPFLFVFWDEKKGKFIRDDEQLKTAISDISKYAKKEFNLPVRDDYILYDLRRACNLYLKLELGYDLTSAARCLGHSEMTNKMHYSLDEDQISIEQKYADDALKRSANANPEISKRYSRFLSEETGEKSLHRKEGKKWELHPEIKLDSLSLFQNQSSNSTETEDRLKTG